MIEKRGGEPSVILCKFSTLDDLRPRDRKDTLKVLRVVGKAGRFSVFEATEYRTLAETIESLFQKKLIQRTGGEFPWIEVELTETGFETLREG